MTESETSLLLVGGAAGHEAKCLLGVTDVCGDKRSELESDDGEWWEEGGGWLGVGLDKA